jgi:hypothetical protein
LPRVCAERKLVQAAGSIRLGGGGEEGTSCWVHPPSIGVGEKKVESAGAAAGAWALKLLGPSAPGWGEGKKEVQAAGSIRRGGGEKEVQAAGSIRRGGGEKEVQAAGSIRRRINQSSSRSLGSQAAGSIRPRGRRGYKLLGPSARLGWGRRR